MKIGETNTAALGTRRGLLVSRATIYDSCDKEDNGAGALTQGQLEEGADAASMRIRRPEGDLRQNHGFDEGLGLSFFVLEQ